MDKNQLQQYLSDLPDNVPVSLLIPSHAQPEDLRTLKYEDRLIATAFREREQDKFKKA